MYVFFICVFILKVFWFSFMIIIIFIGILKSVIYLNEDIIYKSKTDGDCMFFIVSGTVALITFNGKEVYKIQY